MTFPLFSPQILSISVMLFKSKFKRVSKNKLYYLRKKEIPLSQVDFNYVFS